MKSMAKDTLLKKILKTFGRENILFKTEDRICYGYDASGFFGVPKVVIFPKDKRDVVKAVEIAKECNVPIYPRGAGSGTTGGAVPKDGGIVISFEKMRRIIKIDPEEMKALVEPGVITGELKRQVEKFGLFYPPDPASYPFSTIGGNVAECAGGPRAFRYGVTKNYVAGLEIVTPDCEIIKTGSLSGRKRFDLTRLFVGSEGSLGIIVQIELKLLPLPERFFSMLFPFPNQHGALLAAKKIIREGFLPAAMEFMDKNSLFVVKNFIDIELSFANSVLIVELCGTEKEIAWQKEEITHVCEKEGAFSPISKENVWLARRSISPALARLGTKKINEDVVVPRSEMTTLFDKLDEIEKRFSLLIVSFGHAGDGNFHINIMVDKRSTQEQKRAKEAVSQIFSSVIKLGGSLSGEHGIGLTKKEYLSLEFREAELKLTKKIKDVFDKKRIMNPDKIL